MVLGHDKPANPNAVPTSEVHEMRSQGMSNNQIIQTLQRQGFDTQKIVDAMNQAEMTAATPPRPEMPAPDMSAPAPAPAPSLEASQPDPAFMPEQPPFETQQFDTPIQQSGIDPQIEEIAEAIIDEKWNELVKHVNKIVQWKQEMEGSIHALEARFSDLKQSFESLQQGLVTKVDEYDRNISNVGSEIKAMEKVFEKVLPELTNNVNELSRITRNQKKS